ncbi:hypothetical protein PESP_a0145 [Pseudoalteromonas espejiana DSM 9414]|uniref:Uncharacterized protein n=1 Tax=Pseudoalteromonas espejiana TaxID=28107 RepID=A0A510Y0V1_9GAMM|nr:hypothetical protein PESP_a0145 [Pseudoalteromonas espejiana DSM 9414]GEK56952.1 hypothetical protein PES01_37970 [Pseudoalteromonas espejiana]
MADDSEAFHCDPPPLWALRQHTDSKYKKTKPVVTYKSILNKFDLMALVEKRTDPDAKKSH